MVLFTKKIHVFWIIIQSVVKYCGKKFTKTTKYGNTSIHYANAPMQYTAIFHGCKNDKFHMKNCDIFLIFAQNIDCGYT